MSSPERDVLVADVLRVSPELAVRVAEAIDAAARFGEATLDALRSEVERLRALVESENDRLCSMEFENVAWMNGVADVVEPLGFDREAACGPADLLPGLTTLVEQVAARDATIVGLRAALAPFAAIPLYARMSDEQRLFVGVAEASIGMFAASDVRRAAAVLGDEEEGHG